MPPLARLLQGRESARLLVPRGRPSRLLRRLCNGVLRRRPPGVGGSRAQRQRRLFQQGPCRVATDVWELWLRALSCQAAEEGAAASPLHGSRISAKEAQHAGPASAEGGPYRCEDSAFPARRSRPSLRHLNVGAVPGGFGAPHPSTQPALTNTRGAWVRRAQGPADGFGQLVARAVACPFCFCFVVPWGLAGAPALPQPRDLVTNQPDPLLDLLGWAKAPCSICLR